MILYVLLLTKTKIYEELSWFSCIARSLVIELGAFYPLPLTAYISRFRFPNVPTNTWEKNVLSD